MVPWRFQRVFSHSFLYFSLILLIFSFFSLILRAISYPFHIFFVSFGSILRADRDAASRAVAVDFEGVRLGRFGRVCLMQLQDGFGRVLLCDVLRPHVLAAFAPLLESHSVLKVIHDCREDSAALYGQHEMRLENVFDTQVAHQCLERSKGRPPYQASASELLGAPPGPDLKSQMLLEPQLWAQRPLKAPLVAYALHSVHGLLELRERQLLEAKGDEELLKEMTAASQRAVDYRELNSEFPSPDSMVGAPRISIDFWAS